MELEHFSPLADALPGLVWTALVDGRAEYLNQRWREYTGLSLDQAIGFGWHSAIHPEDLPRVLDRSRLFPDSGQPGELQARLRRHDGQYRRCLFRAAPIADKSGRVVKWCGINTDIEDRLKAEEAVRSRESEAQLKQAHAQLTVAQKLSKTGSFTSDLLRDEHIWSDEFYRICEFEPGSKVTIQKLRDIVHPEDLQLYDVAVERGIAGDNVDFEFRIVTPQGAVKHLRGAARVSEFIAGRPVFMGTVQDVTESKLAEQALRASERNARLIVDTIPGLVAVFTPSGEVELVNRQSLEYFGRPLDELGRWRQTDMVHPEDLPRTIDVVTRSMASGEPFDMEVRARRFDGVYRWVQSRGLPLRDTNGHIVRWYNLLVDIDERKQAEEARRASEAELRRAYGHLAEAQRLSKTGSFTSDLARDEHTWSDEFYRICEFEPGSKITTQKLQDIVVPEDVPAFQSAIGRAIAGEDPVFGFRIVTQRGTLKHLLGVAHRLEQFTDRPVFLGAVQDVTQSKLDEEALKHSEAELKRAHAHLTEAQRLSQTGSFTWDVQADDHTWSAEIYRIFGFEPGVKVTMPMIQAAVHPEDLPTVEAVIGRAVEGVDFDLTFRIITPSGIVKHAHVVGHRNEQFADRPVFLGALQDVTETKIAEDALNRARAELAHVTRVMTLGALTASIAHEVNQPLSGIITNASTCLRMLGADPPNLDGARATAQRTLRDGNRASEVIQRLRAMFARRQPTTERFDLNEAAREVLALSSSELQGSRVIVRTDFDAGLPIVTGDRVQLQQVILNLFLNAADAMRTVDDRPRSLVVATARQGGDRVRLSVRDSGVGIDPQNIEKLFEAFYTTKSHGMGVGLSISRSIIESHEGHLWATNNYGPGATFSFSIPCQTDRAAVEDIVQPP